MLAYALIVVFVAVFCAIALVGHILLLVAIWPRQARQRRMPQSPVPLQRSMPTLGAPVSGENFR